MMQKKLITFNELLSMIAISKSHYYKMRKQGQAPPYLKLGNKLMFKLSEVEQWLESQSSR